MEKKTIYTWADLKKEINELPEKVLNQKIRIWGEEEGFISNGLHVLDEDHIDNGESFSPKSTFEPEELKSLKAFGHTTLPKGTPIISIDF